MSYVGRGRGIPSALTSLTLITVHLSPVEEMDCVGTWKEGSARYLITRHRSPSILYHENAFRCIIYERAMRDDDEEQVDYLLSESAEATCSGMFSPHDGSTRLKLRRIDTPHSTCRFPSWATISRRQSGSGAATPALAFSGQDDDLPVQLE